MISLPFRFYAWTAWTASIGVLLHLELPIVALTLVLLGPYILTFMEGHAR